MITLLFDGYESVTFTAASFARIPVEGETICYSVKALKSTAGPISVRGVVKNVQHYPTLYGNGVYIVLTNPE